MMSLLEKLELVAENQVEVYEAGAETFGATETKSGVGSVVLENVHSKEHNIEVIAVIKQELSSIDKVEFENFQVYLGEYPELKDFDKIDLSFDIVCETEAEFSGRIYYTAFNSGLDYDIVLFDQNTNSVTCTICPADYESSIDENYPSLYVYSYFYENHSNAPVYIENFKAVAYGGDCSGLTVTNGIDTVSFDENGTANIPSVYPVTTLTLNKSDVKLTADYFIDVDSLYDEGAYDFGVKNLVEGVGQITLQNVHAVEHDIKVEAILKTELVNIDSIELENFEPYLGSYPELKDFDKITLSFDIVSDNDAEFSGRIWYLGFNSAVDYGIVDFDQNTTSVTYNIYPSYHVNDVDEFAPHLQIYSYFEDNPSNATVYVKNFKAIAYGGDYSQLTVTNGTQTSSFDENGIATINSISPETTLTLNKDDVSFTAEYFIEPDSLYEDGAEDFGHVKTVNGTDVVVLDNVHHIEHDIDIHVTDVEKTLVDVEPVFELQSFEIIIGTYAELKNVDEIKVSYKIHSLADVTNCEAWIGPLSYYASDYLSNWFNHFDEGTQEIEYTFNPNAYVDFDSDWGEKPQDSDYIRMYGYGTAPDGTVFIEDMKITTKLNDMSSVEVTNGVETVKCNEEGKATVKSIYPVTTLSLVNATGNFTATYFVEPGEGIELPELTDAGVAENVLGGKQFIDQEGQVVVGTMPDNGDITQTIDGIDTKSVTVPAGYTTGGTISLDNTIDNEVNEQADLIVQIKSAVDNLPEASGGESGGAIETVTCTIGYSGPSIPGMPTTGTLHYVNANGEYANTNVAGDVAIMKNSICVAISGDGVYINGEIETIPINNSLNQKTCYVTGNCTINM